MESSNFIKPRYEAGGFAALPQQVKSLLNGENRPYDAVILLLIDGFGWRFVEKFQDAPFLKRMAREGRIEKLISQFPSTTASHLTTLHSGLTVGEHGVFEWNYYEPRLDAVITPLLFSFAGTMERDTLKAAGVNPRRILPTRTLYHDLAKSGIHSSIFQVRDYTPSTYSNLLFAGAKTQAYRTLPEAFVNLAEALACPAAPAYFVLYYDKLDAIGHVYGPDSKQAEAEIESFLLTMEHIFMRLFSGKRNRTLFLLTADHGMAETNPQTTLFLNLDERFGGIERFLKTNRKKELLVACGSPRDMFLHIHDGLVDEAQAFLSSRLVGQAEVRKMADLVAAGYFGPVASTAFRQRAGDLVILPYRFESVWWYEKDKFEQRYYGHHGGLTAQEMEIPLITWEM